MPFRRYPLFRQPCQLFNGVSMSRDYEIRVVIMGRLVAINGNYSIYIGAIERID